MLDKKIPVLKELCNLFPQALFSTRRFLLSGRAGAAPAELRHGGFQFPAYFGDRLQNGLGEFRYNVKLADLMRHTSKDFGHGSGI